jgi:hypothetical protein
MRKRLITPIPQAGTPDDEGWLDLDRAGVVEVTSEDKEYPVESALDLDPPQASKPRILPAHDFTSSTAEKERAS